jgi:hypothetical protein
MPFTESFIGLPSESHFLKRYAPRAVLRRDAKDAGRTSEPY